MAASATTLVMTGTGFAQASGSLAPASPASATVPANDQAPADEVLRVAGADRYATAALIATELTDSPEIVYLASGEVFADALAARPWPASAPADIMGDQLWPQGHDAGMAAPVLLTKSNHLPNATAAALAELQPDVIRIVGGTDTISDSVAAQVAAFGDVERYAGDNRYEVAAGIASMFPADAPVAFVVTGETYADALTGGAVAGRAHAPILLTKSGHLPQATRAALADLAPQAVVVLGGTDSVSETVLGQIEDIVPNTSRLAGADRYEMAGILAAQYERDTSPFVVSGENWPDALAGSAVASAHGVPLVLTKATDVPLSSQIALDYLSPQELVVLGGPESVGVGPVTLLNAALPAWADELVVQVLSFNDYHGHLEATDDARLTPAQDPEQNLVGGVEYLSTTLALLRTRSFDDQTVTVAAGDLIGGSPFLSGLFHDEPSVESLNLIGLDISSVGNHEFDEGTEELLRMQNGGCHPDDGCYFEEEFGGADFTWLAANVVNKSDGTPFLPGTEVREYPGGVQVGFIGMTLEDTPLLVSPGGVATVDFLNEVETANAAAAELQAEGVEAIVVLLHEGGYATGTYDSCEGISGPIYDMVVGDEGDVFDPSIDLVVTGHTHQPYICSFPDNDGNDRYVTSANQYGRVVTETGFSLSRETGEVIRERVASTNHLVLRTEADPAATALIAKWDALADEFAGQVVGEITADITGDASTCRCEETSLGNLIADAILWGTEGEAGGEAEIALMNIGGIRANLVFNAISHGEQPGEVTYAEAYAVAPFGNIVVSLDLTGDQLKRVLEQQYDPDRGRQYLHLAGSEGLTYTWDKGADEGEQISDLQLNGTPIEDDEIYRVATLSFLAEGGDGFSVFTEGDNLLGGPEDLGNLVSYFGSESPVDPPAVDRVEIIDAP